MSKGSRRRPGDEEAFKSNWDQIFGHKEAAIDPFEVAPTYTLVPAESIPPSVLAELTTRAASSPGRYFECTTVDGWWSLDKATNLYYKKGVFDDC